MILPIGDAPNPKPFTPWVTWTLIAVNALVYIFMTLPQSYLAPATDDPALQTYVDFLLTIVPRSQLQLVLGTITEWDLTVFEHGYRPSNPEVLDLFTSMFMHANFAHLAGNMLFLWIYGDNVEHRFGRVGYLAAYVGTGMAATLSFAWLAGDSGTPLVGASGAISGVLGIYLVVFPRNVVKLFVLLFPFFFNTILLPAWVVLGAYVLIDNLLPLLAGGASNVAYGAHLGGFVAGALIAAVVGLPGGIGVGAQPPKSGAQAEIDEAEAMFAQGVTYGAVRKLARAAQGASGADKAILQLAVGRMLVRLGREPEAYQWLSRALLHPTTQGEARAALLELEMDPRLRARFH